MVDDKPDVPDSPPEPDKSLCEFEADLSELINKHSLESSLEMPDFVISKLLVNILKAIQNSHARNNCWHNMEAYPGDYKDLKKKE